MGCSSSKEIAQKRAAKESWYAPVSRSVSAPIHYVAQSEEDSCHVVSLLSSSYGILKMERPGDQSDTGSFTQMLKKFNKDRLVDDRSDDADFSFLGSGTISARMKLKPVEELPENDADLEVINTWELMEGLEDGGGKTPSPLMKTRKKAGKSLSFSSVQELDSCFAEMGSPSWRKYYLEEEAGRARSLLPNEGSDETEKGVARAADPTNSPTAKAAEDCSGYGVRCLSGNAEGYGYGAKCLSANAERHGHGAKCLGFSAEEMCRDTRVSGDLGCNSPQSRSPLKSPQPGVSSPLFDPSLMATFERALDAATLPESHWAMENCNEGSTTTNSSSCSSDNHTWVSSETSSDAESSSPDAATTFNQKGHATGTSERSTAHSDDDQRCNCSSKPLDLDSFELKCPSRGEQKVVLYFTSLRGVRKTYEDCCAVRAILQGYGVRVDERDVWMHAKFREELKELLGSKGLQVPRLFVKGRHIGGSEEVKRLHEDGVLMLLIDDLPTFGLFRKVCDGCADVRFVPCPTCSGSCKVLADSAQVARCPHCNENGLIMCPVCCSS